MAFTAKATAPFVVISVNDEALDKASVEGATAVRKYREERDPDVLKCHPGVQPTRFHCRPLRLSAKTLLDGEANDGLRDQLAFRLSVFQIDGLALDGAPFQLRMIPGVEPGSQLCSDESMAQLYDALGSDVIREIGFVAFQRAGLSATQKKAYLLPLGYRVNWETSSSAIVPITLSSETLPSGGS